MRKTITFLTLILSSIITVSACVQRADSLPDLTIFVLDSAQALLPQVEVSNGKVKLTTLWDGRVVLRSGQWDTKDRLTFSCDGFEKKTVSLSSVDASQPLLVTLKSTHPKPTKGGYVGLGGKTRRDVVLYSKSASYEAEMDGAVYLAVEESSAPMAMHSEAKYGKSGSAVNSAVSAGRLTAGEVNDFARWNFWQHVLGETHARFVNDWRIAARHRYTVQLTNAKGYPLANRSVNLLDGQGNTLFQAVTDNTGKAELWYQLINNNLCGKHTDLFIDVEGQRVKAKDWSEGLNSIVLDEPCEAPEGVDVMFVFDATGSMGDELRYLQAEMKDVISRAKEATGGLDIRTGALVYRDHGDEYLTRVSRLTDKISTTQQFIDRQSANGGGDFPEAVPEALMAALNSGGWNASARTRIAFLILDAPCHQDSVTVSLLQEQILNAASMGVRIVPVVCSGLDESGELLMRSIALATNGTSFFLTDDSGIGNPHLKPTTDSLKVEHLNDMLVRTIVEFSYMPECQVEESEESEEGIDEQLVPNPFKTQDVEADPTIPQGPTTLYLLDISGKLIAIMDGVMDEVNGIALRDRYGLSSGVYFLKAYYDGQWHTRKILIR